MHDTSITKLSGLDINPQGASEKKLTGLYIPSLNTTEITNLSSEIVRDGGIVYDSTIGGLRTRKNNKWIGLSGYRTGSITNIGDVGGDANPDLSVTGSILTASKSESQNGGNTITITYDDLGYTPLIYVSVEGTGNNDLYEPCIRPNSTSTQAEIYLREGNGLVQNVKAHILLMQPDV